MTSSPQLETQVPETRSYWCFISYRHADNKEPGRQWATWLHQSIETYEVPTDLVGRKNERAETIPERIFPVFRDEEELPVDADLASPIFRALENSKYLVVICSPRAVASTYVANEIRYFKQLGRANRVLAAMIEGEPNASWDLGKQAQGVATTSECFPGPLGHRVDGEGRVLEERTEPIAADFRLGDGSQGWTSPEAYRLALRHMGRLEPKAVSVEVEDYRRRCELMKLKIIAGILGVALGTLTNRDAAYQLTLAKQRARALHRWLAAVGLLALLAVAGGIYAGLQRQVAEAQRKEALQTASATDFAIADMKHQSGDVPAALAYLSQSLQNNPANYGAATLLVSLLRNQPFPVRILSHRSNVNAASFSPDGKWIITASSDNTAQVWDARTGEQVGAPLRHDDIIFDASFSPDGRWIVTASKDKTAQVWDARTGQAVGKPMHHDDTVWAASFSPDGKWIVTASMDKTARVWDAKTNEPVCAPLHQDRMIFDASFSPDGKRVITPTMDAVRIWSIQTDAVVNISLAADRGAGDSVVKVSFSPDGKWIVTTSTNKTARIWEAQTGQPVGKPMRHDDTVWAASFSPDGKRVVTASFDHTARVWDSQTGEPMGEPMRHEARVLAASFSPDGRWIVTASADSSARVWDAQVLKTVSEPLSANENSLETTATFSSDGKRIATTAGDKMVRVWNPMTGGRVGEPLRQQDDITAVNFSPDGQRIVTGSGKEARVWDAQTGHPVGEAMEHQDVVAATRFSPDGKQVLTAAGENVQVWDPLTGQPVGKPIHHLNVTHATYILGGKEIVTSSSSEVRVWDAQTGNSIGEPIHDDDVLAIAISPDGTRIVTGLANGAKIWDVQTGKAIGHAMRHDLAVMGVAFSPDGKRIVTASNDKTSRIWNAQTGEPVTEPMLSEDSMATAVFSPDGRWVVTAAQYEGVARIWDAQTGRDVDELAGLWDANGTFASFSPDGKWVVASFARKARVWDAGCVTTTAPDWLETLAEAGGGRKLNANGVLDFFKLGELPSLREKLRNLSGQDDLSRFGRWFIGDPFTRTISPASSITVPEFIAQRLQENTDLSVNEAYRLDPGDPILLASLAKFEKDKDRALFLCRHALQRAEIEGPPEKIKKVRSIANSIFPASAEFSDIAGIPSRRAH
jgi:WD40 repeat protein